MPSFHYTKKRYSFFFVKRTILLTYFILFATGYRYWTLSTYPDAIPFLKEHPHLIHWDYLCANPNAISLLEANRENIDWGVLSSNPNAVHLLEEHFLEKGEFDHELNVGKLLNNPSASNLWKKVWKLSEKRRHCHFCVNTFAVSFLKEHPQFINWACLSKNENPEVLDLLFAKAREQENDVDIAESDSEYDSDSEIEIHENRLCWRLLSENPIAIPLLEKYPHKINWLFFSRNPNAICLLASNPEKICWKNICMNTNAIPFI